MGPLTPQPLQPPTRGRWWWWRMTWMLQRRPSQPPFVYEFIHVSQFTAWINKIVQLFEVLFTEYLENKYQLNYMMQKKCQMHNSNSCPFAHSLAEVKAENPKRGGGTLYKTALLQEITKQCKYILH